jgi:hypothetical protein
MVLSKTPQCGRNTGISSSSSNSNSNSNSSILHALLIASATL